MFGAKDLVVAVLCLFFEYSQLFVMRGGGGEGGGGSFVERGFEEGVESRGIERLWFKSGRV